MTYHYDKVSPHVYDKAKYHYEATDFPKEFPIEQAYVHTGFFVGWLVERGFLLAADNITQSLVRQCRNREITGADLYGKLGECLLDYMINEEGNLFAREYYNFSSGAFLPDYREILAQGLSSDYAVKDTWENFVLIKERFDQRFQEWKARSGEAHA